jgi:3-phenylpropionate/trans-cinnamate dioxygenase ferredoxin reductase component
MEHFKYFIVGGGMTADAAVTGIRSIDATGSIALVSAETDKPYDRPPLSKALWNGKPVESIWRKTDEQNVALFLGRTITDIRPETRIAVDSEGLYYSWDKLLLATGGSPRRLPFGDDQIIYFRTLSDYRRLRSLAEKGERIAVIGGGFIGSEIAAALAKNGKKVTMIFPGPSIANQVLPKDLSKFVFSLYQQKGVQMVAGAKVDGLEQRGNELILRTNTKQEIAVDGVVAGIGIEPNVKLAEGAGLKIGNGIVVDELLRTRAPDIYAAGDVANFKSLALGKRLRVEHEDNANTMGRLAGRNMAGASEEYKHLPMFYSDLFELGYEAVGELDSRLDTFVDWKEPNREGVIYYLQDGCVRGVLLWNVWGQVDAGRALISEPGPFRPENLKGRIK